MRNSLVFDTVDTLEYGVVIDGEAVFDAPERDVEVVTIPGRNGTLQIDNGRFENIDVTYPASIWADAHGDFKTKIRDLRNAFASKRGYKRLTDTYHPDEYRLGVFKAGLECDPGVYNTAAEFDIVFDCKPQRFLTSGETSVDVSSAAAQSFSGNPINVYYATGTTLTTFESVVPPYQPGGAGALGGYSEIASLTQGATRYNAGGTITTKTWTANAALYGVKVNHKAQTLSRTYDGHAFVGTETINAYTSGGKVLYYYCTMSGVSISSPSGNEAFCSRLKPVVYTSPTALNNGEITHNGTNIYWRIDGAGTANDMKTLLSTWNANGEPLVYVAKRSSGTSVAGTVQAASFSANTAYSVASAILKNTQYIQHGVITLAINGPVNLVNETDFEARPLLSVTGTGTVNVGDVTITIGGGGTQMYIDCDIAEAWSYSGGNMVNRNGDVSMSSADFPSLPPGANVITFSAGITQVLVTPRWWRV